MPNNSFFSAVRTFMTRLGLPRGFKKYLNFITLTQVVNCDKSKTVYKG
jgi:hypothetical protein